MPHKDPEERRRYEAQRYLEHPGRKEAILAIAWLYYDTHDTGQVIRLTESIFWTVLPSLVFFLVLPLLLKAGVSFLPALLVSSAVMVVTYLLYTLLLTQLGVHL